MNNSQQNYEQINTQEVNFYEKFDSEIALYLK